MFWTAAPPVAATSQVIERATAIVGATIIDGNGGPPIADGTIVVVGNQISAVGPRGAVNVPNNATIIDGNGKFVTPGFIDANTHVSLYALGETIVRYEDQNANLTLEAAQLHLKHGITTIRDTFGSLLALIEIRDAIARGDTVGPRMLVAGNIIGWGGPYSISMSLHREDDLTLFQERFNDYITQGSGEELMAMGPEELRVAVNKYMDKGPDLIKYGGTSHFPGPTMIGFSPRAQRVIVEEAHKRGMAVDVHSSSPEGLRLSVLAGIDVIQHPEIVSGEITDEVIDLIVERDVVCAILANWMTGEAWQRTLQRQPHGQTSEESSEQEAGQQQREKTSAELRRERRARDYGHGRRNAQKLIEAGCITTIGTDTWLGNAPEFSRTPAPDYQKPGIGTIIAIEGLVELGMTPMQAIVAATRNGALAARKLDEFGTLEVGKFADILILDADPLEDISHIRRLSTVIRDGRVVDLDALPYERIFSKPDRN